MAAWGTEWRLSHLSQEDDLSAQVIFRELSKSHSAILATTKGVLLGGNFKRSTTSLEILTCISPHRTSSHMWADRIGLQTKLRHMRSSGNMP
jgi:hypothetical protein